MLENANSQFQTLYRLEGCGPGLSQIPVLQADGLSAGHVVGPLARLNVCDYASTPRADQRQFIVVPFAAGATKSR